MESDVVVVGAGVVGLAVAAEIARKREVILVESHGKFGQETSSRNSEVIHSGIHYPKTSWKTRLCLRGRPQLYEFCATRSVPHARTGKYVVATNGEEVAYLEGLAKHCQELGVPAILKTGLEIREREPLVTASAGLFFPETGIVDSHQLMAALETLFVQRGGSLAYRYRLTGARHSTAGWQLSLRSGDEAQELTAGVVVNCAGLAAAELSNEALGSQSYEHRFCRGRYFTLPSTYRGAFSALIYPLPQRHGIGVHVTRDLEGNVRLGPDVDWCETSRYEERERWYDCDWDAVRPGFVAAARRYCPSIESKQLQPGLIGIRPKLFVEGKPLPDFLIENHHGWIHCLGIESPGLTSALAIADEVIRFV